MKKPKPSNNIETDCIDEVTLMTATMVTTDG